VSDARKARLLAARLPVTAALLAAIFLKTTDGRAK